MQRDTGRLGIEVGVGASVDLVNPPSETVRSLVTSLHDRDSPTASVRLLATSDRIEAALDDWTVAARTADLLDGTLQLRTDDTLTTSTVAATDDDLRVYVFGTAVETSDDEAAERIREHVADRWAGADEYAVETPGLRTVETTLARKLSTETRDDFLAFCAAAAPLAGDSVLNERVLLLLAGARNDQQNYEIGQWADYHGFSSRSMINRVKTDLTDAGVVDIEKQSGHVGRPRQILTLPPDLADRSRAALLDAVGDALSD
jgi:hypothetical protein